MKSAISNWIYLIYGYSIEIQISDIVYYKVCSIWYTKHFIFERSLASQNCFVALWHLWIVVLTLSTSHIEEVLRNCLMWENRKHCTKLQWSVLQQSLLQLQLYSTTFAKGQILLQDKFCQRENFPFNFPKGKFLPKDNFCWREKLLRENFCLRKNFAKGKILLRGEFCLRTNFAKGKKMLRENFCLRTISAKEKNAKGKKLLKDKFC